MTIREAIKEGKQWAYYVFVALTFTIVESVFLVGVLEQIKFKSHAGVGLYGIGMLVGFGCLIAAFRKGNK